MASRREAVALIKQQLKGDTDAQQYDRKVCSHYGRVELRELLDLIYGGPPNTVEERVPSD